MSSIYDVSSQYSQYITFGTHFVASDVQSVHYTNIWSEVIDYLDN